MKKEYILFIDSGMGGLSTLGLAYKNLPTNYIYYADNKNAPYGNHTKDEVYRFVKNIVDEMKYKYNILIVVLACNTATTAAIERLRTHFKTIKFIGTEPAIKLGYKLDYKRILMVATPTTIKQKKYKHLMGSTNVYVKNLALPTFASSIENFMVTKSIYACFIMQKNIYQIAQKSRNSDCLILGCTHYVLIKHKISKITQKITLDGNFGVLKQVLFWHAKLFSKNTNRSSVKFVISGDLKAPTEIYKKIFHEILAKV